MAKLIRINDVYVNLDEVAAIEIKYYIEEKDVTYYG